MGQQRRQQLRQPARKLWLHSRQPPRCESRRAHKSVLRSEPAHPAVKQQLSGPTHARAHGCALPVLHACRRLQGKGQTAPSPASYRTRQPHQAAPWVVALVSKCSPTTSCTRTRLHACTAAARPLARRPRRLDTPLLAPPTLACSTARTKPLPPAAATALQLQGA